MEVLLILAFPILLIVAVVQHAEKKRQERIKAAYNFTPPNVHGGARFANNDDLRKAGLFK